MIAATRASGGVCFSFALICAAMPMRWNISAICTPLGPLESAASRVFFSASQSQVGLGRACAHCDADARFHHVDAALRSDMALPDALIELRPCHDDCRMPSSAAPPAGPARLPGGKEYH